MTTRHHPVPSTTDTDSEENWEDPEWEVGEETVEPRVRTDGSTVTEDLSGGSWYSRTFRPVRGVVGSRRPGPGYDPRPP